MFDKSKLVRANGLLEGSTIVAILLGVLAGGWLADHSVTLAFGTVLAVYALAALCNLLIPRLPPERPLAGHQLLAQGRDFLAGFKLLWHDREARFSLMGTSLFWGSGATLRLMLFAWVPVALALNDNQTPANLMGVVSIGIVVGAFLAGLLVSLAKVNRALIGGLLVGPLLMALAFSHSLTLAGLLLMGLGAAGGFLVVPLNALLQDRGHGSIGAGRALAVQNFWENIAMLICVWLYAGAGFLGMPIVVMVAGFGGLVLAGMAALAWSRRSAA
jgi:LPLT family lysophospholipid transporter-like MFS transporter